MMLMKQATARSQPGRLVLAASVLLALLVAALWWRARDGAETSALPFTALDASTATPALGDPPRATAPMTVTRTAAAVAGTARAPRADWPASLRDSEPDGAVTLDANGRVIVSRELRRLFDYFLSALGERDVAAIRKSTVLQLLPKLPRCSIVMSTSSKRWPRSTHRRVKRCVNGLHACMICAIDCSTRRWPKPSSATKNAIPNTPSIVAP